MLDIRRQSQNFLRLYNKSISSRKKFGNSSSSDGIGKQPVAVIKTGDVGIDNHCAPLTLSGEVADQIGAFRQQQLRVYMDMCHICSKHGVVLDDKLLRAVFLHPADRPYTLLRRSLRQPSGLLSVTDFNRRSTATTNGSVRGSKCWQSADLSGRQTVASLCHTAAGRQLALTNTLANDVTDVDLAALSDTSDTLDPDTCIPVSSLYRSKKRIRSRPTIMKLSTGSARIERKVDCWLTFEEYLHLTSNLSSSATARSNMRHLPDDNAVWSNRLLDKLRLVLPPNDDPGRLCRVDSIFHRVTDGGTATASRSQGRYRTGLRSWPINQSGYVQYGTINK
jgi:hypothetical protein